MSQYENNRPPRTGKILVVGGYGHVGRSVAERLAPHFPGLVSIAGRNLAKAKAAAAEIGHGADGRAVDLYAADAGRSLDGVALVLVCLDQTDTRYVEQCLSRGIHYVDISADHAFLSKVEKLDDLAKQNGAAALLSVGVAPGLTNLLAARAREKMENPDQIDILLEFGLGDKHGQAAVEWMFDNLDARYEVLEQGRLKMVQSFGERIDFRLPNERKGRPAYRFNFSDQHAIGHTLGVPSVSTWVRFENRFSTWLFAKSSKAGLGRLLRRPFWRRIGVWLFMKVHVGSDICGVAVRATGQGDREMNEVTLAVIGQKEALMTAIVAAEMARQVLSAPPKSGVYHSDQVIALDPVIDALRKEYPKLEVTV